MKKQNGFTLIELMIVVAVIGVLSAIAIPQYQKYVAKAEIASVLTTLTGIKTNVEASVVETGTFPTATSTAALINLGAPAEDKFDQNQLQISYDNTKKIGVIGYKFPNNVTSEIANKTISLTRDDDGNWKCQSGSINIDTASGAADTLLPKNCR